MDTAVPTPYKLLLESIVIPTEWFFLDTAPATVGLVFSAPCKAAITFRTPWMLWFVFFCQGRKARATT